MPEMSSTLPRSCKASRPWHSEPSGHPPFCDLHRKSRHQTATKPTVPPPQINPTASKAHHNPIAADFFDSIDPTRTWTRELGVSHQRCPFPNDMQQPLYLPALQRSRLRMALVLKTRLARCQLVPGSISSNAPIALDQVTAGQTVRHASSARLPAPACGCGQAATPCETPGTWSLPGAAMCLARLGRSYRPSARG